MKKEKGCLEEYPNSSLGLSIGLTFLGYLLGGVLLYLIAPWCCLGFLILIVISLLISMKFRCSFCYYCNKKCSFGLGKIAKLFFRPGDNREFKNSKNLLPAAIINFAVLLLPLISGIIWLILNFSLLGLTILAVYLLVGILPGFLIRKNLICKQCRQGALGCPAYQGMKGEKDHGKDQA